MKGKSDSKLVKLFMAVIGLAFVIVGLAINLPEIIENGKRQKIADTGTEGVGYHVYMHESGVKIDDEELFYLTFSYVDGEGIERSGRTSSSYDQAHAAEAVRRGRIDIIYNDRGAVEKSPSVAAQMAYMIYHHP